MTEIVYRCKNCRALLEADTGQEMVQKKMKHMGECHPGFKKIYREE